MASAVAVLPAVPVSAQSPAPAPVPAAAPATSATSPSGRVETPEERLKRLEETLQRFAERDAAKDAEIRSLTKRLDDLQSRGSPGVAVPPPIAPGSVLAPAPAPAPLPKDDPAMRAQIRSALEQLLADPDIKSKMVPPGNLAAGYKKDNDYQGSGFYIKSGDDFYLQLEGRGQFRYTYYNQLSKDRRGGVPDRSGNNRDVRSDFEFNRILFDAGGYAFAKNITYRFQPIVSTNNNDAFTLNQAFVNWNVFGLNEDVPLFWRNALQVRAGQFLTSFGRWETNGNAWGGQIPTDFQLIDRPIAVQALKPDRSIGVEVNGVLGGRPEGLPERPGTLGVFQYQLAINNGFNAAGDRFGLDQDQPRQTDKYPSLVARGVFDLLKGRYTGEDGQEYYWFGRNQSDLEQHETPAVQTGGSFAWQRTRSQRTPVDNPRLGNVYRNNLDPLDAGSDAYRVGSDVSAKYAGASVTGELYYQFLNGLDNDRRGARNLAQNNAGWYVSAGYFVIPHTVELVGGYSGIYAPRRPQNDTTVADNAEVRLGVNYFPFHSQKLKLSLDGGYLRNPAVNVPVSGVVASERESAWQIRAQLQYGF